jgi:hypothetical protein
MRYFVGVSWANHAKKMLAEGETVQIKPRGHSMKGKVNDGDLLTVSPCELADLSVGDVVLVRCRGNDYLHLIKAKDGERLQIGNNRGGINGWVGMNSVYGKAIKIEPGK